MMRKWQTRHRPDPHVTSHTFTQTKRKFLKIPSFTSLDILSVAVVAPEAAVAKRALGGDLDPVLNVRLVTLITVSLQDLLHGFISPPSIFRNTSRLFDVNTRSGIIRGWFVLLL